MPITAAPTVRESVEAAVETVMTPPETAAPVDTPAAPVEAIAEATPATAEAPKDDRARDKDGKFIKTDEKAPKEAKAPEAPAAVAQPPKPKVPRPTSWKKELESHWDTLPPEIQSYVQEREKQYATGVSTYKSMADESKEVMGAINQFAPMLQAMNIPPAHWIKNLGVAHHFLANGTPQEKVQTIADIIRNNRVDTNALMQMLSGQQPQFQHPAQGHTPLPQTQQKPVDIGAEVNAILQQKEVESAYKAFTADVEAGKYPHFADEEVKGTMAGLLHAGLAQDYPSAYEAALAMPKHRHLAPPATTPPTPAPDPAKEKQAQAARARSQAVSVKSSTPSTMTPAATGKRSLREELSGAFDSVTGGGRV